MPAFVPPALPAPPIGYRYLTLAAARQQLAVRLQDSSVYWSPAELNFAIAESLHVFQALTSWYRQRVGLPLSSLYPGGIWYDLATAQLQQISVPPVFSPNGAFDYNIFVQSLTSQVLYALLEPQLVYNSALGLYSWTGTDQFSLPAVQAAIGDRINRFLGDSGAVLSYLRLGVDGPPVSRFTLPDTVIDVRRASWQDAASVPRFNRTNLNREDDFAMSAFGMSADSEPGIPQVYSLAVETAPSIQVAPPPANVGALELLVVQTGFSSDLSTAAGDIQIPIPDDFLWAVKWGALADLLSSDGQARDPARATYCERRYQEGVQLSRAFPSILRCQVLGTDFDVESAFDLDCFAPGWDNTAGVTPGVLYAASAGRNLFAVSPQPTSTQTITLDIAGNIPIPQRDSDYLQIPRDLVDVILDYAQHTASFKMGGEEFATTGRLHQNLLFAAGEYNARLRQMAFYNDAIRQPGLKQLSEVPRV